MMNIICRPDVWTGISGDYGENGDGGFTGIHV